MKTYKVAGLVISIGLIFLVFQNCSSQNRLQPFQKFSVGESGDSRDMKATLPEIDAEIRLLIANPNCNEPEDCATIGYGSKACGGPVTYLVYSRVNVDSERLQEMVTTYNVMMAEENARTGLISTCEVPIEPPVACIENQCQKM